MAKKKRTRTIDIEIDKLTNSIEEVATGKTVATHVGRRAAGGPPDPGQGLALRLDQGA
jgi:hypothetical protein